MKTASISQITEALPHHDRILILDFGSQVTQLIARRLRESGVYCEIWPYNQAEEAKVKAYNPKGLIFSGSPCSVYAEGAPHPPPYLYDLGLPIFGICYGQQVMMHQLGGKVEGGDSREFGRAYIDMVGESAISDGVWAQGAHEQVWMSHGDRVTQLAPGFKVVAKSAMS